MLDMRGTLYLRTKSRAVINRYQSKQGELPSLTRSCCEFVMPIDKTMRKAPINALGKSSALHD